MAGTARLRRHRRFGSVGRMTAHARHSRVVDNRIDLRKPGRTRWIVGMAQHAQGAVACDDGLHVHRSRHVLRCRLVADLARHASMVACEPGLSHVTVAQRTLRMSRVLLLASADRVDGGRSEVPPIAKGLGNEEAPGDEQANHSKHEHCEEPWHLLWHRRVPRGGERCRRHGTAVDRLSAAQGAQRT
jgi:hypothetical protein